ncbi:helix-turn-helix domain-containing protein [Streptomyces sp. MBT33]|uniref:helix-turn-helix domain-containing protein n=1 Tax=Streptomyces sp. MBT33 TaxID=1488363 RepID=UPI00190C781D|nr:helix-turn-helix domain-containing protein [Streptomyces sp. MBT33]MBK3639888.1 helix-turn-helix domain-containing protein [Streptomyces sp. MBT33]
MREQSQRRVAHTELCTMLEDGLARASLSKAQLAVRAGLGRTTVHAAFQAQGPLASAQTLVALARVLRLPVQQLLDLRRIADGDDPQPADATVGPGKPIGEWDAHVLEVHPATTPDAPDGGGPLRPVLPGYIPRAHDRILSRAVTDVLAGHSRIVVVVGESSTGKTRALWEAVQPLAEHGWTLWHPYAPTRQEAARAGILHVHPHTVVWLNDSQHYMGDPQYGDMIAALIHTLLNQPESSPVLVLGTLWPEHAAQYTALPKPQERDRHSRARELLAGRLITVPAVFSPPELAQATALADQGDELLADTLSRTKSDGRVTQDLAGAPELLRRYTQATPAARAVLEAAMDACRLGASLALSQDFLTEAAAGYLDDHDFDQLADDWKQRAVVELTLPVHGKQAPLRRIRVRPDTTVPGTRQSSAAAEHVPAFRLADYLDQLGRRERYNVRPPDSFWHSAHTHLSLLDDLKALARAAQRSSLDQWASHLRYRAADLGDVTSLYVLGLTRERAGDRAGAETLYRQAAAAGDIDALHDLALLLERTGDQEQAEEVARRATAAGSIDTFYDLARLREDAGDGEGARLLYRQAAAAEGATALGTAAARREKAGDTAAAQELYQQAAEAGHRPALGALARLREQAGDLAHAQQLFQQAVDAGDLVAVADLARIKRKVAQPADVRDAGPASSDCRAE